MRTIIGAEFGEDISHVSFDRLLRNGQTIRSVHSGKKRIPPEIALEIAEHQSDDALTEREIEVLRLVAEGSANKLVADRLCITEETVKAHMRHILSKLGVNDRTHAVTIALKRGIIDI